MPPIDLYAHFTTLSKVCKIFQLIIIGKNYEQWHAVKDVRIFEEIMRREMVIFYVFTLGCVNRSGLCVFGCEPSHGTLQPGESREIIISFSPDSTSEHFHDKLEIDVDGIVSDG